MKVKDQDRKEKKIETTTIFFFWSEHKQIFGLKTRQFIFAYLSGKEKIFNPKKNIKRKHWLPIQKELFLKFDQRSWSSNRNSKILRLDYSRLESHIGQYKKNNLSKEIILSKGKNEDGNLKLLNHRMKRTHYLNLEKCYRYIRFKNS